MLEVTQSVNSEGTITRIMDSAFLLGRVALFLLRTQPDALSRLRSIESVFEEASLSKHCVQTFVFAEFLWLSEFMT